MATIAEPGTTIENSYDDNGRCVRQVNWYPDAEPYIFDFTYRSEGPRVIQAASRRSDGTWAQYTFDDKLECTETRSIKIGRAHV